MAAKLEDRYLRVYCPTHKVSFTVPEAGSIICDAGGEALAQNFPQDGVWEYCCDCQSLWPSNIAKGGKAAEQCIVCSREIKRRYVCNECKAISLESDESAKRKAFTIARGLVEPRCPGCLKKSAEQVVREHECDEAGVAFTTALISCPFCDEQIADRPTFPTLAAEYLEKIRAQKIKCRLEPSNNLLVEDEDGDLLLIPRGSGTDLSIVLPTLTRFASKQDYFNYKKYYDCDEPSAGDVFIIYPAVADKLEDGWRLREAGRLKVKKDMAHDRSPVVEIPAEPVESYATCPNCSTPARPENLFCKECGYYLKAQEAAPNAEATPSQNIEQDFNAPAPAPERTNKRLGFVLALVGCAALILIIATVTKLPSDSGASVESKLDSAINRGSLTSPAGESAYDYYQQLKRDGVSRSTLSKYESRLLPLLTQRPQEMITNVAQPDGRDARAAEWEEAAKALSWASEIKANESSLAARAEYCKGRAAFLDRRVDEALRFWKSATELDHSWALPLSDSGYVYLKDKAYKDLSLARKLFSDAISRDKNWAVPYVYKADTYYLQKLYDDAKPYYEDAARLASQWPRAHAALGNLAKLRGNTLWEQGNYDLAHEEYLTAEKELELALELISKSNLSTDHTGIDNDLSDVRQRLQGPGEME